MVLQGKCNKQNIITFIAVIKVHPCWIKILPIEKVSSKLTRALSPRYDIKIIGNTISLAGNPNIKAVKIYPSNPISFANGSKIFATNDNNVISPICKLANNQIIKPAGAATAKALPKTNIVLSKIERTITFPICGFL